MELHVGHQCRSDIDIVREMPDYRHGFHVGNENDVPWGFKNVSIVGDAIKKIERDLCSSYIIYTDTCS